MSQHQAACLLANAFFCTFPSRNFTRTSSDDGAPKLPSINFNTLYKKASPRYRRSQHAKLDCLLNYFRRVTTDMPTGALTFTRQVLSDTVIWYKSKAPLQPLHITPDGTIEDSAPGLLHVDFANKIVGGGVLGEGCVQEEIRFLICPELIVSRLLTEELALNESLLVTGAERFSDYIGYGNGTQWAGSHIDRTPRDAWSRRCTQVVAIDAAVFRNFPQQVLERSLYRELNKAYSGFHTDDESAACVGSPPAPLSAVATGNWGCGVFGGDLRLKALLQLMAASHAGRPVAFFTFGDRNLCSDLHKLHTVATSVHCNVGRMWNMIKRAALAEKDNPKFTSADLYRRIVLSCGGKPPPEWAPAVPTVAAATEPKAAEAEDELHMSDFEDDLIDESSS